MATTLYEFYTSQGQNLPSVEERKSIALQAGIQNYTGTAQQNDQLLSFLKGGRQSIPINVALNKVKPMQLPSRPIDNSAKLIGLSRGFLTQPTITNLNELEQSTQIAEQNAQTATDQYRGAFTNAITGRADLQQKLESEFDIAGKTEAFNLVRGKFDNTQLRYRREKEAIQVNPALSEAQKSARIREIERKEASELADIAIDYNLKTNQLNSAKELLNEKKNFELDTQRMILDYYREIKNDYQNIFDETQKIQIDRLIKQEERNYQMAQKNADRIYDLQLRAMKSGVPWDKVRGIKSLGDYAKSLLTVDTPLLSAEQKEKIASNSIAKQAVARIGVINAISEYNKKVQEYKAFNIMTPKERAELLASLRTTVGSAINVAQGQGAMGNEEADRILSNLSPDRLRSAGKINSAANGIINAQKSLLTPELNFLDSVFPGATKALPIFSNYLYGGNTDSYLDKVLSPEGLYSIYVDSIYGK